jgi:hypothetical protein
VSTRELIEKEIADLSEPLQREVFDFARSLRTNGTILSTVCLERNRARQRLESSRGGRLMVKPLVGEVVVLPFPQTTTGNPANAAPPSLW